MVCQKGYISTSGLWIASGTMSNSTSEVSLASPVPPKMPDMYRRDASGANLKKANLAISNNRFALLSLESSSSSSSSQLSSPEICQPHSHPDNLVSAAKPDFVNDRNQESSTMVLRRWAQDFDIGGSQAVVPDSSDNLVPPPECLSEEIIVPHTPAKTAAESADHVPPNTPATVECEKSTPRDFFTPVRRKGRRKKKTGKTNESQETRPFSPYPCNPEDPADICVDQFLRSQTFEFICAQAFQLATVLPIDPPPSTFNSFEETPMHQWYQSLLMEFIEVFGRLLRQRQKFPQRPEIDHSRSYIADLPYASHMLKLVDDEDAFNREAKMHCSAILASFHFTWSTRSLGSQDKLYIDSRQPNAHCARLALLEVTSYATWAPKKGWKVGDKLHPEFRRRLRNFDTGVVRIISERPQDRWVLNVPHSLARGTAAYKEYCIAQLRREYLAMKDVRQSACSPSMHTKGNNIGESDDVFD